MLEMPLVVVIAAWVWHRLTVRRRLAHRKPLSAVSRPVPVLSFHLARVEKLQAEMRELAEPRGFLEKLCAKVIQLYADRLKSQLGWFEDLNVAMVGFIRVEEPGDGGEVHRKPPASVSGRDR